MTVSRRLFFVELGGLLSSLALLFPRPSQAKTKKVSMRLSKVPQLEQVGGQASLKIKGHAILLMRTGTTSIAATSSICTHAQCPLFYNHRAKKVECDCHGSKFELDGKVMNGPAKANLTRYKATLSGDKLIIEIED